MNLATQNVLAAERALLSIATAILTAVEGAVLAIEEAANASDTAGPLYEATTRIQKCIASLSPRIFTGEWSHPFGPGRSQTLCRVLIDARDDTLICAQGFTGKEWVDLAKAERDDLADSLFNANDVTANPEDFSLEPVVTIPDWVGAVLFQVDTDTMPEGLAGNHVFRSIEVARATYPTIPTGAWRVIPAGETKALIVCELDALHRQPSQGTERFGPFLLRNNGMNVGDYQVEARYTGDPGINDEARISVLHGTECVADVLVGLTETGEPRVLVTTGGDGDGDHTVKLYPLRTLKDAVECDEHAAMVQALRVA